MIWSLTRAEPDDAAALTRLAHASKAYWGYHDADLLRWRSELTFDTESLRRANAWCARRSTDRGCDESGTPDHAGKPLSCLPPSGMYLLRADQADRSTIHLEHFWVHPDAIGQGLGRRLFLHAQAEAMRCGGELLRIESDPNAEPFYLHMGACRVGALPAPIVEDSKRVLPVLHFALTNAPPIAEVGP